MNQFSTCVTIKDLLTAEIITFEVTVSKTHNDIEIRSITSENDCYQKELSKAIKKEVKQLKKLLNY